PGSVGCPGASAGRGCRFGRSAGSGRCLGNCRRERRSGRGRTAGVLKGTGVSPRTARRGPPARPKSEGHRLLPTRACLLLCLVLVAPHAAFATTPAKDAAERPIAADPGIHYRVLPNGMRYWIRPDAPPEGKVSLWLRVDSGSLNEDDDQRGIAHLLEHLAFNGSANFPAGTLIRRFEAAGLTFGAHQNATTSYTDTTYKLTVPNDPKLLDLSLLYFADVAFRLTLDPEEVE